MLDSNQPLAELHDIVAAPAAHWWPLAPGWYALAVLLLALWLGAAWCTWRWWQRRRVRNAALKALATSGAEINAITLLVKQACLGYFPAEQIAALSGPAWFSFMAQQLPAKTAPALRQQLASLADCGYQPHQQSQTSADYQQLARYWLRHALPPRRLARSPRHD